MHSDESRHHVSTLPEATGPQSEHAADWFMIRGGHVGKRLEISYGQVLLDVGLRVPEDAVAVGGQALL